ncbi:hypothetical protein KUL42_39380 [Alteromonas sp. KUL42]|uniref:hypothetical protein n=1 Tax=Alteromonas sp. KUL42 TaxID=2480797 RepID=UPI00103614C0|nr:hypothetical protein [Alteromonas sp. KUL42]TAP31741.1 hypothetical protein EYR97_19840 [Alteromonas sp. KUL42]GEA09177.1 hypothetical protein KUL42_39380 [Alteromonas sp. KUL42]
MGKANVTGTTSIESRDIDKATDFSLSGYNSAGVRAVFHGKEGGFCTTSYSFSMSQEAKNYSAARIALLLQMASGLTNEQISQMKLINT